MRHRLPQSGQSTTQPLPYAAEPARDSPPAHAYAGSVRTFSFTDSWSLSVGVDQAYAVLADVEGYPSWWPQVRRLARIDEASGHAYVRSLLPYTLDLVLTRSVEDPDGHVLRVSVAGDLEGWSQFRIRPTGSGCIAHYSQEATLTARGLEHLAAVAAPVLRANHRWMMWSGARGLRDHLASQVAR